MLLLRLIRKEEWLPFSQLMGNCFFIIFRKIIESVYSTLKNIRKSLSSEEYIIDWIGQKILPTCFSDLIRAILNDNLDNSDYQIIEFEGILTCIITIDQESLHKWEIKEIILSCDKITFELIESDLKKLIHKVKSKDLIIKKEELLEALINIKPGDQYYFEAFLEPEKVVCEFNIEVILNI